MPNVDAMDTTTRHRDRRDAGRRRFAGHRHARVANCFLIVDDHDKALSFYRDVLGFTVTQDVTMGDYRWLSVSTPTQPELEITIQSVGGGPGTSEEDRTGDGHAARQGADGPLIFSCDDVDALFEHVRASGVGGAPGAGRPVLRRARLRVPRPRGQPAALQDRARPQG